MGSRWRGDPRCSTCGGRGWVLDRNEALWTCPACYSGPVDAPDDLPAGSDQTPVMLSMLREAIEARATLGPHRHAGPAPCPVCGGMRESA